jgi:hypothetical protein
MDVCGISRLAACATVSLAATVLTAASAHAAQFVATDVRYVHSAQTTTDSHYRVNPSAETPASWTAPVDYASGSAHVRLEVFSKPNTTTQTCFQVCFEATTNYGCTDISKPYTTLGVYEWDTPFSRFFTPGPVSWNTGVRRVALLLKDTMNGKPAPENVGAATSALYMPTDVRVTVTIVSPGSVYQPPAGGPATSSDAGTPPTPRADAGASSDAETRPARDAAPTVDARVSSEEAASEASAPPPERPASPEAAAPAPTSTTTSPPTTGGQAGAGGSGAGPIPSGNPPATPSDPVDDGGGCSVVRLPGSRPSNMKMLASVVLLALAASRRRRVKAPGAKGKACL